MSDIGSSFQNKIVSGSQNFGSSFKNKIVSGSQNIDALAQLPFLVDSLGGKDPLAQVLVLHDPDLLLEQEHHTSSPPVS
jgi:hypothetical protein